MKVIKRRNRNIQRQRVLPNVEILYSNDDFETNVLDNVNDIPQKFLNFNEKVFSFRERKQNKIFEIFYSKI